MAGINYKIGTISKNFHRPYEGIFSNSTSPEPPIVSPGIYHNTTNGLISISSDGTNWLTIADKNLGATQVYNNGDTLSEANCGKYFQWGNCYGFPFTGATKTNSSQVSVAGYGPGNYYTDDTFRTTSYWTLNPANYDLWGGSTGTPDSTQGPCPNGYHIPLLSELQSLLSLAEAIGLYGGNIFNTLKIPATGYLNTSDGQPADGTQLYLWSSTLSSQVYGMCIWLRNGTTIYNNLQRYTSLGYNIRPFANTPVQPDSNWTVLYQPQT